MSKLMRPEPLFFHFRALDPDDSICAKGGATVVFHPIEKKFGVALCCPKDRFCKRTGAKIAYHRLGLDTSIQHGRFPYAVEYIGDNEFEDVKMVAKTIARTAAAGADNQELLAFCPDLHNLSIN